MANWIANCQICNDGLCIRFNELKAEGYSNKAASRAMSEEAKVAHPELADEFSEGRILNRYRYHQNGRGKKGCQIDILKEEMSQEGTILPTPGWVQQCKIAFRTNAIGLLGCQKKKNITPILKQLAKESGLPLSILKSWWYEKSQE